MAKYDIANMYIANKMRDASDAALAARVSALEAEVTTLETMSTTERVVGKWIDGRDIFEKVLDLGDLPTSTTAPDNSKEVSHGVSDVDKHITQRFQAVLKKSSSRASQRRKPPDN